MRFLVLLPLQKVLVLILPIPISFHYNQMTYNVQHLQMNSGILMARESDKSHLALFLGSQSGFDPTFLEYPIWIVIVVELVKLPQVNIVRPQTAKTVFQI